jgi:hypothetical protein
MTRIKLCTEALRVESFQTAQDAITTGAAHAFATQQCSRGTCDSCLDNCTIQITCIDC